MRIATLCLVVRGDEVLLAKKKSGFGANWWNGFGGKVKEGEDVLSAACREVFEESGLRVAQEHLKKVAVAHFRFPEIPEYDQDVHTYLVERWEGEPQESEEMQKGVWFTLDSVPYHEMWPGDDQWLPLILRDKKIIESDVQFSGAQPPHHPLSASFREVSSFE